MYRGDIRRHWPQICCRSILYDGLFGEGCLRASANQARVLTWRPGRLEFELQAACRVCAHTITNNARNLFLKSSLLAFCFATPIPFLFLPRLQHTHPPCLSADSASTRCVSLPKTPAPTPQLRLQSTWRTALVYISIRHNTAMRRKICC